jgi:hypothetical protein
MIAALALASVLHAYTIIGDGGAASARVVTEDDRCPSIAIDDRPPVEMTLRAGKADIPPRKGEQEETKESRFPVLVCEHPLPKGARRARVDGVKLAVPVPSPKRIVFIGDTGCRMKASEDAWQDCGNKAVWPFADVSRAAAKLGPDLVVHVGDVHYRESRCPGGTAGCVDGPWGYGYDAWEADLFTPAESLLRAAPWVVVRGNHESCSRAGLGWFRFLDPGGYSPESSCEDREMDLIGDFTAPYAVPLPNRTQLLVFDSSRTPNKRYASENDMFAKYREELQQVDELAAKAPHSIFLSHHPILGFQSGKGGKALPGNGAMQHVMGTLHPDRLFPRGVDLAIHGHVHLFESLTFASDHPSTFVTGNAGSLTAEALPQRGLPDVPPAPGAVVSEFSTREGFGFLLMERVGSRWRFTEYDANGTALIRCGLHTDKLHCVKVNSAPLR